LGFPGQGGGTFLVPRVPPPAWADALASGIKADLRAYFLEVLGMATIVTTMLYVPAAGLLAALFLFASVPVASLVSFGHALHPVAGLAAWWAIFFVPALVYCGFIVPWDGREPRT
jgi:hypothetical protein